MHISKFSPILLLLFLFSSFAQEADNLSYISFTTEVFEPTDKDKIEFYYDREDIPERFFEIGVLKSANKVDYRYLLVKEFVLNNNL